MSDEEQPLPDGWEKTYNESGVPFYVDINDIAPPVWVRPTEPTPKLLSGWEKVKGDGGSVYFRNKLSGRTQTEFPVLGQAFDDQHLPRNVGVLQPQQQPVLDIPMPDNTLLNETERALISSMQDGRALLTKIDEYDAEFEKLKVLLASPDAQPFDLSVYTAKLEAFRLLLIEKLESLKTRIDSLSNLAGLSVSLITKLDEAKTAYQSVINKLSVVNNPAQYKALGVKIAELETLINGINDSANAPAGGRKNSKTKNRISRGKRNSKGKKTKRVKRTKTIKRKRRGGKCNCSLWAK